MARHYTVDDVLAYMEIPLPEDDDFSDDEFDGYIEEMDEDGDNNGDGMDGDGDGMDGDDEGDGMNTDNNGDGMNTDDNGEGDDSESIPKFVGEAGCTQDMANKSPIDFLQLFVTDDILQAIVEQTNLFAQQFMDSHELPRRSRARQWDKSPHCLAELKKFLAAVIIMGLVDYPCMEDYWVTSWPFATTTFHSILKRDILPHHAFPPSQRQHEVCSEGQPGCDPLYKLRPFMDPLIANFQAAFTLGRELSVDEAMIGFKGRLWFKQYMPKKPTKWGMKAFVLADSVTGYIYAWKLYAGM